MLRSEVFLCLGLGWRNSLFGPYCFLPQTIETTKEEQQNLDGSHLNRAHKTLHVLCVERWSTCQYEYEQIGFLTKVLLVVFCSEVVNPTQNFVLHKGRTAASCCLRDLRLPRLVFVGLTAFCCQFNSLARLCFYLMASVRNFCFD